MSVNPSSAAVCTCTCTHTPHTFHSHASAGGRDQTVRSTVMVIALLGFSSSQTTVCRFNLQCHTLLMQGSGICIIIARNGIAVRTLSRMELLECLRRLTFIAFDMQAQTNLFQGAVEHNLRASQWLRYFRECESMQVHKKLTDEIAWCSSRISTHHCYWT